MDLQLLIVLVASVIIALGIGFLLGRRMINKKNELQLEFTSLQYNRSETNLNESDSALKQSKKELDIFKKTSIKEFEKLKAALERATKELAQAQTDLAKARTSASSVSSDDNSDDSAESAQPTEERRTDIRRADEKNAANMVEELLSEHMRQFDANDGSGHLDTTELADDFFSVDVNAGENGSSGFFSTPELNQKGNGKLHEQEALINQYIEKARIQQSKIDELLAENEVLRQAATQAKNVEQSDDESAQSPADAQSLFEGLAESDAEDNTAEINKLKLELQLSTQRVRELTAEVKTLTAEKTSAEEAPQQAASHDKQPPANSHGEATEHEELRRKLKLAIDQKEQLSAEVGKRITERDELAANLEQVALREEKLSSDVESLTKSAETLRKRKDNAELLVESLRDENAGLRKTADIFKEQYKELQASVPNEAELKEIELTKESQQNEILSLTRKLQHADRINNELQQRSLEIPKLESELDKLDELNALSDQQASQIASHSQTVKRLKEQNDELRLINSEYLNQEQKNESLSRENVKLRAEVARIPEYIKESNDARSQLNELTELVETARNTETELKEIIETAQVREDGYNAQIENALKTEAELRDELEKAQRSQAKLDNYHFVTQRLESLQLENRNLSAQISNFDELAENYKAMRDRNDELEDQINQFESKSGTHKNEKSELLEHKAPTQGKAEVQLELNVELAKENSASAKTKKTRAKKKVSAKSVGKKSPKVVKQSKKKKASVSKLSASRKAKGKKKLQKKDDLKQINGIGPKLEKLLNSHGISTFEQLAQLSKPEADELAIKIGSFGERIKRDKWVSKAKKLVKVNKKAA